MPDFQVEILVGEEAAVVVGSKRIELEVLVKNEVLVLPTPVVY